MGMGEENVVKVREILRNVGTLMMSLSNPNLHLASHLWPLQAGEIESLSKNEKVHKSEHWRLLTSLKYPKSYSARAIQLIRRASLALAAMKIIERRYLLETRLYVAGCHRLGAWARLLEPMRHPMDSRLVPEGGHARLADLPAARRGS